jgi:two-component system, LuxR family, response regulator FixJ
MISESPTFATQPAPQDADALVCVVDDDESVRCCFERLFRSVRLPVETFATAGDYLDRRTHPGPVCLVLDVRMPGLDGFGLQKALAGHSEQIIFLTGHGDVPMCAKAMKAGAVDFLTKPVDEEILLSAVSRALVRAREFRATQASHNAARTTLNSLTRRESEVMDCVIAGMLNKQIAARLGIAEKTVKIHRGRMMRKSGCISVPDLVRLVQRAGPGISPTHP